MLISTTKFRQILPLKYLLDLSTYIHEVMSDSFETPWTVTYWAPLFTGFPRQEYWSGLLLPSPEDLPDPGIKLMSPALAGILYY